jgi:hypothetical protein
MKRIDVSSISFDELKDSFIEFAKSKEQYSDWEFGGSNISFLIDMLTYSTYYNTVYHAMMLNETFLDTATQRSSVVARAKEHGYIPKSRTSAYMNVTVNLDKDLLLEDGVPLPPSISIPLGTTLSVKIQDFVYTFNTTRTYTVYSVDGVYELLNVMFYEGYLVTNEYTYYLNPEIIIPTTADMSTLKVEVNGEEWRYAKSAIQETSVSKVYYYYENGLGEYSVYFGDGVISSALDPTSMITISYLESAGPNANAGLSAYEVSPNGTFIENGIDYTKYIRFNTSTPAGGKNRETIEEIRRATLRRTITQNRAVTVKDFIYVIETEFYNEVLRCNAWDINTITENIDPYDLGKVYICVQPRDYRINPSIGYNTENNIYKTITSNYTIGGIRIQLVDPVYIKVNHNVTVYYDNLLLNSNIDTLKTKITSSIRELYDSNIIKFDTYLPISRIQSVADSVDNSIISTSIKITCSIDIFIPKNIDVNVVLDKLNSIIIGSVSSNIFGITDVYTEEVNGEKIGNLVSSTLSMHVGTINYTAGIMAISIPGSFIENDNPLVLNYTPENQQISVQKQYILIDSDKYNWDFKDIGVA